MPNKDTVGDPEKIAELEDEIAKLRKENKRLESEVERLESRLTQSQAARWSGGR